MAKFYAVRKGLNTGIYTNWNGAGYQNSIYF